MAQSLASFHGQPGIGYHELRSIWENDETYSKYFSESTTAKHIVLCYTLLLAIQSAKLSLVQREKRDDLAEDEQLTLAVFRQRGSHFLLVASVASCIEILLDRRVSDRFSLSFGTDTSPSSGRAIWKPVVDALLPFAECLHAEELKGSLRNETRVDEAIKSFRRIVRSTARNNEDLFSDFASHVEGG